MAYIDQLFDMYYMEHASYVIKDRAIPDIDDGLKPVQRRILHTLHEMDDGKFHKVANVMGSCMKFHPHGDQSINAALVNLANKDLLIEKQGNFGNILTGDDASAARYIECRLTPLAQNVLVNPEITQFEDSYDGRNKEPVAYPAKIPVLLAQGTEGIAVGMSTRILPHNLTELLQAQIAYLRNESFQLYPDFPTGGQADITEYADGTGKVTVRATVNIKDPKRIVITELPYGSTTESLIASIENAIKKNKLRATKISDYTGEKVEIEVQLARGVLAGDVMDAIYAFTDCEKSISVNALVIKNKRPHIATITDILKHNTDRLVEILKAELELEQRKLRDRLHAKTLEQIFIENRVYQVIEEVSVADQIHQAIRNGLGPFGSLIRRAITGEDLDRLLQIPIRRISLYDINKAKEEMREIRSRLREVKHDLGRIVDFTIDYLSDMLENQRTSFPRRTAIESFDRIDAREAAHRSLKLKYDKQTGYLGYEVIGTSLFDVSTYDRILVVRKNGLYSLIDAPSRLFVDKNMLFCGFIDPSRVYTVIYREIKTNYACIKRCKLDKFILDKGYELVPAGCKVLNFTTETDSTIHARYKPKPRVRILEESFQLGAYPVRGKTAKGIRLAPREIKSVSLQS